MSEPTVADHKPKKESLKKDENYFWCTCGRSGNQPFCDGSHRGSDFTPLKFSVEKDEDGYLCMCKHTKNPPYCDGSHKSVKVDAPQADSGNALDVAPTPEEPTGRVHS